MFWAFSNIKDYFERLGYYSPDKYLELVMTTKK